MTRRATAQDVADLAGVSRSTVSLVLNGRADGNISATKQVQVIEAARQLTYRPNAVALSLRSQRSWAIGALTWRGRGRLSRGHAACRLAHRQGRRLSADDHGHQRRPGARGAGGGQSAGPSGRRHGRGRAGSDRVPAAGGAGPDPDAVDQLPRPRPHGGQHRARRAGRVGQRGADPDRSRPFPDRSAGRRHGHGPDRATDRRRAGRLAARRHPALEIMVAGHEIRPPRTR